MFARSVVMLLNQERHALTVSSQGISLALLLYIPSYYKAFGFLDA